MSSPRAWNRLFWGWHDLSDHQKLSYSKGKRGGCLSTWRWLRCLWANWSSYYRPSHYHLDIIVIFGGVFFSLSPTVEATSQSWRSRAEWLYYIYAQHRRSKSIFGYASGNWLLLFLPLKPTALVICHFVAYFFWNEQNLRYDKHRRRNHAKQLRRARCGCPKIGGK